MYNVIMNDYFNSYRNWQYKNTFILILSIILLLFIIDSPFVKDIINKIGNLGYLGAFLAGVFFVSIFTVAPAALVIYDLASKLNPYEVALFAGIGGVIGDYVIFRILKDGVFDELTPLLIKTKGIKKIGHLFRTPYFSWLIPIFGAVLIASPVPDEIGIGILGLSKIKNWQFVLLTFFLNAIGIFTIVLLAKVIQ